MVTEYGDNIALHSKGTTTTAIRRILQYKVTYTYRENPNEDVHTHTLHSFPLSLRAYLIPKRLGSRPTFAPFDPSTSLSFFACICYAYTFWIAQNNQSPPVGVLRLISIGPRHYLELVFLWQPVVCNNASPLIAYPPRATGSQCTLPFLLWSSRPFSIQPIDCHDAYVAMGASWCTYCTDACGFLV